MWEVLTGEVPWPGKSVQDLLDLARSDRLQLPVLQKHYNSAPAGYIDLMRKCMDPVPAKRPAFREILKMIQESRAHWASDFLPG